MLEFELNNKTRRQKNFRGSWILTFQLSDNTYIDTYIHIHMYIGVINGFLQVSASCVHRTDSAWNLFWLFIHCLGNSPLIQSVPDHRSTTDSTVRKLPKTRGSDTRV
jgi:hypothetical protein